MKKTSLLTLSAIALAISTSITALPATAALPMAVAGENLPSLAPMLETVSPAVVSISVEGSHTSKQRVPESFRFFFGPDFPSEQVRERPFRGLGSGVIVDAGKGFIVTNHHVIDGANKIRVQLHDGREYDAELIGSDSMSDVALLKLEKAENLTEIKFADSDALRVGDFAIAIGNPFGLGQTVTSGIISALGRSGLNLENFENFIQTDAAINSGNSGGALVNLNGELVGINTAILGPNGGNVGIGFAIPVNMTKNLVEQILEFGEVRRGVLGVQGGELTSELAEAFGYETNHGAFVSQVVPDSAAAKAGIEAGDIIISVNGKEIRTFGELRAKVATLGAGKKVKLGLIRDGKDKTVTATLKEAGMVKAKAETLHEALTGAELENYSEGKVKGIRVARVEKDSIAARYGLKHGDIIVGLNRNDVKNLGDFRKQLESKPNVLALNIVRGESTMYLVIR
ncbi:Do family serine endopeptidase [Enterovibrio norvegicus]|uniref:Serine endoprotease DegQ n=1 Tax=Enterovibrio norvegicus TaxID=188144 RepID=A0A2N7LCI4_9GAMM|nr:Do family serine endopeptidase [Enterovibrio norvegicus]PML77624.1 serine endoprotease DegQ [Enterovibrio norvegicus]PMN68620.1 serine endoprotease DegQ [Enterovibrio norvegicus]PMN93037.1 serine endoprotease DegQ [Enterovibrio norvegicus]TKF32715.1 Do family serine endopeptidase [Enterovibrio norvegicus]